MSGTTPAHIDPGALAASLDALGAPANGAEQEIDAGIARVIEATRGVFAVTGVGLMLVDAEGSLRYVGATDPQARALEAAQEDLATGPCIDGFVAGEVVMTEDIAHDERWPELSARVVPDGVVAVLGVPVRIAGTAVGSLNVYRSEAYGWDDSDVRAVAAHAGVIESMLSAAMLARGRAAVVEQLQGALDRRVIVERAVGMLMERHGVTAVVAFGALRRAARDERRAVADLAARALDGADVIGGRLPRPEPA